MSKIINFSNEAIFLYGIKAKIRTREDCFGSVIIVEMPELLPRNDNKN